MFSIVLLGSCTKTTYCVYCTEVYTEMETVILVKTGHLLPA